MVYVTLDYWLTDSFVEVHNTGYRSCPTVTLFKPTSRGMRIETNNQRKSVKSEKIGRQGEEKKSGGCSKWSHTDRWSGRSGSGSLCALRSAGTRSSILNTMARHPLFGFVPRMVTAKQVQGAIVRGVFTLLYIVFLTPLQDSTENPFTRLPHSDRYHKILEARKKLPVYTQMDDFYKMVSSTLPSSPGRFRNRGHVLLTRRKVC